MKMYVAFGNNGEVHKGLRHPRKELMDYYGTTHADIIYRDRKNGSSFKCGYKIAGIWFDVYQLSPMEG